MFRFLLVLVKQKPFPSWVINPLLMIYWKCYIHPFADIRYFQNIHFGKNCRIGKCKISAPRKNNSNDKYSLIIGAESMISDGAVIATLGGHITIGKNVSVQDYSIIYGLGGVEICEDTRIAASVIIVSHEHQYHEKQRMIRQMPCSARGISIGQDCWIGAGARILDGVTIADRAIVGAGSVVTKTVERETIVVGVPAKHLKCRFENGLGESSQENCI